MNIKRPFAPTFLNKLDNFLLLNKPSVWAARAHLVVYYSLLFIVALSVVYYAVPDDPRSSTSVYVWVGFLVIIAILALVAWLIYLLRFNVFKRYGIIKPTTTLVDFLLYFVATSTIISFCFVPLAIETIKANQQYTSEELTNDINNINTKICQLEYDTLPKKWRSDTLQIVDTLVGNEPPVADNNYDTDVAITEVRHRPYEKYYRIVDTARLADMISNGDSLIKMNDSIYIAFECPDYLFVRDYNMFDKSSVGFLTSKQLYYTVIKPYVVPDKVKVRAKLKALLDKYYYADNDRTNYYDENLRTYKQKIEKFYKLQTIDRSISNIADRKYRWSNYGTAFWMFWYYFSFSIALMIFAFRRTTARVFFLSLLSIIIILILMQLFMVFFRGEGFGYFTWMIFYFILFAVLSATTFSDRKRKAVKGIAINLFVFMLPFIPLIATGLYYVWLEEQQGSIVASSLLINYDKRSLHFLIAEIAGPLLFLVILAVYIHSLYRRWWGLPEE